MILLQGTEKGIPVSDRARQTLEDNSLMTGFDADAGIYVLKNRSSMNAMNPSLEDTAVISAFIDAVNKYAYNQENLFTASSELAENLSSLTQ